MCQHLLAYCAAAPEPKPLLLSPVSCASTLLDLCSSASCHMQALGKGDAPEVEPIYPVPQIHPVTVMPGQQDTCSRSAPLQYQFVRDTAQYVHCCVVQDGRPLPNSRAGRNRELQRYLPSRNRLLLFSSTNEAPPNRKPTPPTRNVRDSRMSCAAHEQSSSLVSAEEPSAALSAY